MHHAAQAGPGQLAGQQVDGRDAGDHRQQGAEPDALQPHRGDLGAGHRRDQFGAQCRQQVPVAAQRLARGAGQHDRLQQRHHGQQLLRARFLQGEAGGAVRADVEGEFGQELGDVQADLQVAGCHVAVAGVEQHGLAAAGEQDPVRGQPPVGHLAGVQPGDRVPDVRELVVAAPGIAPGQRGPVVVLEGEYGGFRADADDGAQPRRGHVGVLGRVGQQSPALDHPVHRQRGAARHRREQPHRPVDPVEGARGLLVPVEHHDVQRAVRGGHRVVAGSRHPGEIGADSPDHAHPQVGGS